MSTKDDNAQLRKMQADIQADMARMRGTPPGLSLYEYYAGQALVGLLASGKYGPLDTHIVVREAHRLAAAMRTAQTAHIMADGEQPPGEDASLNDRLQWCVASLEEMFRTHHLMPKDDVHD